MDVVAVGRADAELDRVIELWRRNSKTLGFFPRGAFEAHAARGWIQAALNEDGACVGYVVFRMGPAWTTIVQLCVAEDGRGHGVASALVARVRHLAKHLHGMKLTCRRDYEANDFWPKLGFVAVANRPGKASEKTLTEWRLRFDHRDDLFTARHASAPGTTRAAIDHNVFLDLHGRDCRKDAESWALREDWVLEQLQLVVTGSVLNEIDKYADATERARLRVVARAMEVPLRDAEVFSKASAEFRSLGLHEPDARQVARAIASDVDVFVTRDERVLKLAEDALERYDLAIARPAQLITMLDELVRREEYRPARLAQTRFTIQKLGSDHDERRLACFQLAEAGEKKADLLRVLRTARSQPREWTVELTASPEGDPVCVSARRLDGQRADVSVIRAAPGRLQQTHLRKELARLVECAVAESAEVLELSDPPALAHCRVVAEELGFVETRDGRQVRLILRGVMNLATVQSEVARIASIHGLQLESTVQWLGAVGDSSIGALRCERAFSPLKLDVECPTFIVPIRPQFAERLFGVPFAQQPLFGSPPELAFSLDHVYYRAAQPRVLDAPGRVLWYVSGAGEKGPGRMEIRACSQLREVTVAPPKVLYKRFAHLGVYRWKQLLELAHDDVEQPIMGLRFDRTELLEHSLPWDTVQEVLSRHASAHPLVSPVRISHGVFRELYERGRS